jgi:hypothetical protein
MAERYAGLTLQAMFWSRRKARLITVGEWDTSGGRTRVLLENPDRVELWAYAELLRGHGYDVATCAGPDHDGLTRCPLLESGRCSLVEGADVVASSCSLVEGDAILARLAANGSPPVVFEAPKPEFERYRELAPHSNLIGMPVTEKAFLAAVAEAAASI